MATKKKSAAGFFDLPLELRQQIYGEILRPIKGDRRITVFMDRFKDPSSKLREADPRIKAELAEMEGKLATKVHFTVDLVFNWKAPSPITFQQLNRVDIEFYRMWPREDHPDDIEQDLKTMFHNLRRFVAWFKEGNSRAEVLVVHELDDDQNVCWVEKACTEDGLINKWKLATRERVAIGSERTTGKMVTVVESLLMPLKAFPVVVNSATVSPIQNLVRSCMLTRAGLNEEPYGAMYGRVLCETWKAWLEGERTTSWRTLFQRKHQAEFLRMDACGRGDGKCFDCYMEDFAVESDSTGWDSENQRWRGRHRCSSCGHGML